MLNKSQLLQLKLPVVPKMIPMEVLPKLSNCQYLYFSRWDKINKILIITLHNITGSEKTIRHPEYVVYVSPKEKKHQSVSYSDSGDLLKWHTAKIEYLTRCFNAKSLSTKADKTIIRNLPKNCNELENGYYCLRKFQNNIGAVKLSILQKERRDRYKKVMSVINPRISKGFRPWIEEKVFEYQRFVLYNRTGKNKAIAHCTYCKEDYSVIDNLPKHNAKGRCDKCGSDITYKARGYFHKNFAKDRCCIFDTTKDNRVVIRYFTTERILDKHGNVSDFCAYETHRDLCDLENKDRQLYELGHSIKADDFCWAPKTNPYSFNYWVSYNYEYSQLIYPTTLNKVIRKNTIFSRIPENLIMNAYLTPITLINQIVEYPCLEQISKVGFSNLALDMLTSRFEYSNTHIPKNISGKLHKCLGLDKSQYKQALRLNVNLEGLKLLQEISKEYTDDVLASALSYDLSHQQIKQIEKYLSLNKALKYANSHPLEKFPWTTWIDYLKMCSRLKMDMKYKKFLFPEDVEKAHDNVQAQVQAVEDELTEFGIIERNLKEADLFLYEDADYIIRLPYNYEEFVEEVKVCKHCFLSCSYCKNHSMGETTIVFVRKKSEPYSPYYAMEIQDNKIVQLRGKRSIKTPQQVIDVTNKWLRLYLAKQLPYKQKRNNVRPILEIAA